MALDAALLLNDEVERQVAVACWSNTRSKDVEPTVFRSRANPAGVTRPGDRRG
jgi:hypothetical protein